MIRCANFGGKGIRTPDFQLAKLALYQLSYAPAELQILDGSWQIAKPWGSTGFFYSQLKGRRPRFAQHQLFCLLQLFQRLLGLLCVLLVRLDLQTLFIPLLRRGFVPHLFRDSPQVE